MLLEVQGRANAFRLALVGVIKDHFDGGTLHIAGGINAAMEVGVVPLSILLNLGIQASQIHRTQVLTIIIHICGM